MKQVLVLFTNGFPYSYFEPFLENEYPMYAEYFDKVLIVTGCHRNEKPTREVKGTTVEIVRDYSQSKDILSVLEALPWVLTDPMFYREIKNLFSRKFTLTKLFRMLVSTVAANHKAMMAKRWLKNHPEYQVKVIYSYWMQLNAYAAVRLNQKLGNTCHTISRAHGFDLYEERGIGYIPFHRQLYFALDEVASISKFGKAYLEEKYGNYNKITIHRLGAVDRGQHNPESSRKPFRIVSCARIVPLKRLHRIVDALSMITDHPICWTHLGGGNGQEELEQYAKEKLPANVTATFSGRIPNAQVYENYGGTPFHVFINVSETEGVPVSIMEAMSFDIPVIATAVGGTPELIDEEENGYLLDADFTDEALVSRIRSFIDMPEERYLEFRKAARAKFEGEYNAIPNYRRFIEHLTKYC